MPNSSRICSPTNVVYSKQGPVGSAHLGKKARQSGSAPADLNDRIGRPSQRAIGLHASPLRRWQAAPPAPAGALQRLLGRPTDDAGRRLQHLGAIEARAGRPEWVKVVGQLCGVRANGRGYCHAETLREVMKSPGGAQQLRIARFANLLVGEELAPKRSAAFCLARKFVSEHDDAALKRMGEGLQPLGGHSRRKVLEALHRHVRPEHRELLLRCAEGLFSYGDEQAVKISTWAALRCYSPPFDGHTAAPSVERHEQEEEDGAAAARLQELEWAGTLPCCVELEGGSGGRRDPTYHPAEENVQARGRLAALRLSYAALTRGVQSPFSPQSMVHLMHAACQATVAEAMNGRNQFSRSNRLDEEWVRPVNKPAHEFLWDSWVREKVGPRDVLAGALYQSKKNLAQTLGVGDRQVSVSSFLAQVWVALHADSNMVRTDDGVAAPKGRANRRWTFWDAIARHVEMRSNKLSRLCGNGLAQRVIVCLQQHIAGVSMEFVGAAQLLNFHASQWANELGEGTPTAAEAASFLEQSLGMAKEYFGTVGNADEYDLFVKTLADYVIFEWPEHEQVVAQVLSVISSQDMLSRPLAEATA